MLRFLSQKQVRECAGGVAKGTLYAMMRNEGFPRPRRISPNRVGWLSTDVEAWLESRPEVGTGAQNFQAAVPDDGGSR